MKKRPHVRKKISPNLSKVRGLFFATRRLLSFMLPDKGSEAFVRVILFPVHIGLHCSVEADRNFFFSKARSDAWGAAVIAVCRVVRALVVNASAEMILFHVLNPSVCFLRFHITRILYHSIQIKEIRLFGLCSEPLTKKRKINLSYVDYYMPAAM